MKSITSIPLLILFLALASGCATPGPPPAAPAPTVAPSEDLAAVQKLTVSYLLDQERYEFQFNRLPQGVQGRSLHDEISLGQSMISEKAFAAFFAHLHDWTDAQRLPASSLPTCHQPVRVEIEAKPKKTEWFGCRTGSASKTFSRLMREAEFLIHSRD